MADFYPSGRPGGGLGGSSRHALTQLFPSFLLSFVHFPRTNETCCRQLQRLRAARDPIGRKALSVEKNGCRQEWAPRTDGREPGQAAHRGGAGWGPGSSFHVSAVHPSPQRSPPLPPPAATPRTLRSPLALCRPSAPPGPVRAGSALDPSPPGCTPFCVPGPRLAGTWVAATLGCCE